MTPDWIRIRAEFPTLARWTYLDVARKMIPPRCQQEAVESYYRDVYDEAGADAWAATHVAEGRREIAELLGAAPEEIAFTKNTTEGLCLAANAFPLAAGDNVVLTDIEHVANVWVWKHWERQGVEIRIARSRGGRLPVECFLERMDARTRVVSTAWVTYGNGCRVDLSALGAECRRRGVRLVVDGVQGAGLLAAPLSRVDLAQIRRQPVVLEVVRARRVAEAPDVEHGAVREAIDGTHGVDTGQKAAEPLQHLRAVEFRRTAAATRVHGEAESGVLVQRAAVVGQRSDHRDLALGKRGDERVLLEDRGVAPAFRAVELGDDRGLVVAPDLVDAVLVAPECEQATVAAHTHGLEGVENDVRRESGIRM